MTSVTDAPTDYGRVHELQPGAALTGPVALGSAVSLRTLDSSGGQISTEVSYDELDPRRFFPVTGPIGIDGVRRGDTVGIEILAIDPDPLAHTWTRPGLGLLEHESFAVMSVDSRTLEIRPQGPDGPLVGVATAQTHVGALGLLPSTVQPPRTLGRYGGNIDFSAVGAGATVWLTAEVDGGGFFVGDVHASIGDGEVCGTGAETGAEVTVRFTRHPGTTAALPTVRDAQGRLWVIGIGSSVEEALREATQYCVQRLAASDGLTEQEAYLSVGMLLRAQLCQVVNPRTSVAVSLEGGADRVLAVAPRR
ncbi:MAG TPA: acetamidase/formamidase family protein [Microbacterium sp.]|nr:acetamidase/formamidase family protein [Microbacterium sp.]